MTREEKITKLVHDLQKPTFILLLANGRLACASMNSPMAKGAIKAQAGAVAEIQKLVMDYAMSNMMIQAGGPHL